MKGKAYDKPYLKATSLKGANVTFKLFTKLSKNKEKK